MNSDPLRLYSYRRCPFAIRVRMTLHEKNIPFETVEENLKEKSDELRTLHPEARVPVLVHGDTVLYESAIITEYLDELSDDNPLRPSAPAEKATMRLWTYWCNHLFKPDIDRFKYGPGKLSTEEIEKATQDLQQHLSKIEDQLSKTAWLIGDAFSLADIHVFPFYRQLSKVTPPFPGLAKFKKTSAWLEKITSRPSFEKTMAKPPV